MRTSIYISLILAGICSFLSAQSQIDPKTESIAFIGSERFGRAGIQVLYLGDINGDGFDDFIIVASGEDASDTTNGGAGRSYLYYGRADLSGLAAESLLTASADAVFEDTIGRGSGATAAVGDVNDDGLDDFIITTGFGSNKSAYLFYGKTGVNTYSGINSLTSADATFSSANFVAAESGGFPPASGGGDVNGDGIDDFLLHTQEAAYLIYGKSGANQYLGNQTISAVADATFTRSNSPSTLWRSSVILEDANGDGFADVVITGIDNVPDESSSIGFDPDQQRGEAYLFYGGKHSNLLSGAIDAAAADVKFQTSRNNTYWLTAVGGGDLNNDGLSDLLLSNWAYSTVPGGGRNGQTYIIYGQSGAFTDPLVELETEADTTITGAQNGMDAGRNLSGGGDLNGDGIDDLVVSAPRDETYFIFYGGENSKVLRGDLLTSDADLQTAPLNPQDTFQSSTSANNGDFDGDGTDDLLIGASGTDKAGVLSVGAAYFIQITNPAVELATYEGSILSSGSILDFGSQSTGFDKVLQMILTNSGTDDLDGLLYSISGSDSDLFEIINNPATTLKPGNQTTITARYSPDASGVHTAKLALQSNAPDGSLDLDLLGTGANNSDNDPGSDSWEIANGFDPNIDGDVQARDTDNDGDIDIWEIFQGSPANTPESPQSFTVVGNDSGTDQLIAQYRRSTSQTAVRAVGQWSCDLVNWYFADQLVDGVSVSITESVVNSGPGFEEVQVNAEVTGGTSVCLFYRLLLIPDE